MAAKDWQGIASGVIIGLGFGVGLGMLLAPKSGKETRDRIAGTVKDTVEGAVAQGQKLVNRATNRLDEAKQRVQDAAEAAEQAYREAQSIAS
jgi:gas vesicle protein